MGYEDIYGVMSRALLLVNPGWRAMVATNLSNTSKGMLVLNQIAGSMPICQKQVLAAEQLSLSLSRSRGLATTSARLSVDKKGDDHISLAKKVDPKEAAAQKAAQEATRKALEKKKKEEMKGSEEAEKA